MVESVYFGTEEYHDIINNPVEIADIEWTVADANFEKILDVNDILNEFVTMYPAMDRRLQGFRYLEGTLRVSVIVQGAPYAQGRVIVSAVPNGPHDGNGRYDYYTVNNMRILPHVIVDPSQSATYVLDLPALGPSGMIDLTMRPYSWRLMASVYDTLGSGSATSPVVNMEVRVTLINPKLRGKVVPKTLVYGLETEALGASAIIQGVQRGLQAHLGGVKLSTYATLFSQLSAQAAEKLKMFGFSRPVAIEVGSNLLATGDAFTQVDGRSNVLVLGKSQQMASAINPELMNGKVEEMELSYLLSKSILCHKSYIAPAAAPNSLVASLIVSPSETWSGYYDNPSVGSMMDMYCLGWNGTITYSFEFVCSVFHRATFLVAYSPTHTDVPTYSEALTSLENINVTVSGNTHVKWTIPWRRASAMTQDNNGKIFVYLIDAIRSNGSTDGIHLDVLADLGKTHFHFPKATVDGAYVANVYSQDWIPSSDFALLGDDRPTNSVVAGGDTPRSVKDLVARAGGTVVIFADELRRGFKNGPLATHSTWVDKIIPLYYGWRSSFRYHGVYKAQPDSAGPDRIRVAFDPQPGREELIVHTPWISAVQVFNPAVMNGFDVVAPFCVADRNFNLGQEWKGSSTYTHITKENAAVIEMYRAAGDDFVAGFFLGVPCYA